VLWWVALLGIGFAMLYGKRRRNLLFGFVGVYLVLALATAAAFVAAGGPA
jgi:hypothetical protein